MMTCVGCLCYRRTRYDGRGFHVRLRHAASAPDTSEMKHMHACPVSSRPHSNSLPPTPKKRYGVERSPIVKSRSLLRQTSANRGQGEYAHIWEIRRPIPVATPKVPAGVRSEPDGRPRTGSRTTERPGRSRQPDVADDLPLPPATFMTFKPLGGDHVYESPRFASLARGSSKSSSRSSGRSSGSPMYFQVDTATKDGKPIPPRRSLDQGDRQRLRTMGLAGPTQHGGLPEPNPADEGRITA